MYENHENISTELGNHRSICLKTEVDQDNLSRECQSRNIAEAYRLLTISLANESTGKSPKVSLKYILLPDLASELK
jgi:hypothetical protein